MTMSGADGMRLCIGVIVMSFPFGIAAGAGQFVNPVARCADSGVIKHRGELSLSETLSKRQRRKYSVNSWD